MARPGQIFGHWIRIVTMILGYYALNGIGYTPTGGARFLGANDDVHSKYTALAQGAQASEWACLGKGKLALVACNHFLKICLRLIYCDSSYPPAFSAF